MEPCGARLERSSQQQRDPVSIASEMVRPQDISRQYNPDDLIAEARIEYTGSGVVVDKQAPGFGVRATDHVFLLNRR